MPSFTKGVRVEIYDAAFPELLRRTDFRDELAEIGEGVASRAEPNAPRRTGYGAASIHAEPLLDPDGWIVRVSWARDAYYMGFHELGTEFLRENPFLRPAAEELL